MLSPKRYSVSKPTTAPRHDAILPIGHELMLLVVGCVCLWDKEDIVFFGLKLLREQDSNLRPLGYEPSELTGLLHRAALFYESIFK